MSSGINEISTRVRFFENLFSFSSMSQSRLTGQLIIIQKFLNTQVFHVFTIPLPAAKDDRGTKQCNISEQMIDDFACCIRPAVPNLFDSRSPL